MTRFGSVAVIFALFSLGLAGNLPAQEGFLRVTSVPEGASVELEGQALGTTPLLSVLKPGIHAVTATLAGYATATNTVEIVQNEVTILSVTLERQARGGIFQRIRDAKGNLTVITDWQDVKIYLNGQRVDATPPVTIKDVRAGMNQVILVSGDYADYSRVLIQPNKTYVLQKSFEEDRARILESAPTAATVTTTSSTTLEAWRQALPSKVVVRLAEATKTAGQQSSTASSGILGERDGIGLSFQYRKPGETDWVIRTLDSKTKAEDTFEIEKGEWEIQFTATHYREPTGFNILWAKRETIKQYQVAFKHEFEADTQYTYQVTYDGKSEFSYSRESVKLNTKFE